MQRAPQPKDSEIAIVGGGVVGMSLAFGLSRGGAQITVLDEGDVAYRATRGNFALVNLQGKGSTPDYARWTRRAVDLWRDFADELERITGIGISYEQRGGFAVQLDQVVLDKRVAALKALAAKAPEQPIPFTLLDHAGLKERLPAIGPEVAGGIYCPLDGHVNVLRLFHALHEGCARRGVAYRPNHTVSAITYSDGRFDLATAGGRVMAKKLVLAAGIGCAQLGKMVGFHAPVRPQKGQVMVTEKLERFLDYPLSGLRQTDEGSVMIGYTNEEMGLDTSTDSKMLAAMAKRATTVFPVLARARVLRSWAALRPMTPDGRPLYAQSPSCPGAYLVTGHSGVTLASAYAFLLAPYIAAGTWPEGVDSFSPRRFDHVS